MDLHIYVSNDEVKSFDQEVFMLNSNDEIEIKILPKDLSFWSLSETVLPIFWEGKYMQLNDNPLAYLVDKKTITTDDIDKILKIINAKYWKNYTYQLKKRIFNIEEFIKTL